ncbi:MAG: Holliday junction resolvase RuvX [Microgenomates group bacterium]
MRLLGIDFGLSKIGLALAEGSLTQPLGVVPRSGRFLSKIIEICRENQIKKIIVGFPEGKLGEKVKRFAKELSRETGLPVEFQDETLTTKEAIAKMIQGGVKKEKRRDFKDAAAAACILEEYLKERRESV